MGRRRVQASDYDPIASDLERDVLLTLAPNGPTQAARVQAP